MVIEPGNSGVSKGATQAPITGKRTGSETAATGQTTSTSQDSVSLSSQAHALGRLEQAIQSAPDVDEAKVDALKQAIAEGSYQINSESIADKMLARELL